jgi:hypothetical protein
MKIELREKPTYIHKGKNVEDARVEIKCYVDDSEQRISMPLEKYMEFAADQVNALTHHVTGKTNARIK